MAKPLKFSSGVPTTSSPTPLAGLALSSSWFEINAGHLPLTFRTPPVNLPMQRVYSLEFRPYVLNSKEIGSPDPLLGSGDHLGLQNSVWFHN